MDLAFLLHFVLLILHFFLSALPAHLASGGGGGGGDGGGCGGDSGSHKPQVFLQFSSFCGLYFPHLFLLHFSLGLSAHAEGEGEAAGGGFGVGGGGGGNGGGGEGDGGGGGGFGDRTEQDTRNNSQQTNTVHGGQLVPPMIRVASGEEINCRCVEPT